MTQEDNDKLNASIRQQLDDCVDSIDAETLSKIRQIRAQAVDKVEVRQYNWTGILSGALATACVMVFAVMILLQSPEQMQTVPVDDLELITSSENLELIEELEFYEWLEAYDDDYELAG